MEDKSPRKLRQSRPPLSGVRRALQFESIPVDARSSFYMDGLCGTHFPFYWHYHPELEIDLVLKGRGLRFVGDSIGNFEEGDLCLLGSNLPHTWNSLPQPGKPARSIYVQFSAECFGPGFFSAPEMQLVEKLFATARQGLRFHGKTQQAVMERMLALRERPRSNWRRTCDLIWILGTLAESRETTPLTTGASAAVRSEHGDRRLQRVLDFMNAEADNIPSQIEAAQHARLSPQAFSRFFKRSIGKTYVQYRNELRVGRACRLLLESGRSITEVAMDAGFNNLSNFNAQFLEIKGLTPRAYRDAASATTANVP